MTYLVGEPTTLWIDLGMGKAMAEGDWVCTEAGARYEVLSATRVQSARHAQRNRWRMRVVRRERGIEPPPGSHVQWLRWYPRGRR